MRSGGSGRREPSPEELIRALRGGGRGGRGSSEKEQEESTKMSVGVDTNSNSLVVRAPDPLFEEVRQLVETLDTADSNVQSSTKIVTLDGVSPAAVQSAAERPLWAIDSNQRRGGGSGGAAQPERPQGAEPRAHLADNRPKMRPDAWSSSSGCARCGIGVAVAAAEEVAVAERLVAIAAAADAAVAIAVARRWRSRRSLIRIIRANSAPRLLTYDNGLPCPVASSRGACLAHSTSDTTFKPLSRWRTAFRSNLPARSGDSGQADLSTILNSGPPKRARWQIDSCVSLSPLRGFRSGAIYTVD